MGESFKAKLARSARATDWVFNMGTIEEEEENE